MALYVVKSPAFLPNLSEQYNAYAVVEPEKRKGLRKFFGLRAGSVSVSRPDGPASALIRVAPPHLEKGTGG